MFKNNKNTPTTESYCKLDLGDHASLTLKENEAKMFTKIQICPVNA